MRVLILGFAYLISASLFAQEAPVWNLLDDSPFNDYRSEDVFFVDAETGWAVNGDGEVHRSTDGGDTWTNVSNPVGYLRATGFASTTKGWVGVLFSPAVLYETSNGGLTMSDVTSRIQPAIPGGICGISVVSDQIVYGVGQFSGPAYLIKTTDGGFSWTSIDLSAYADTAVDVKFFDANHGFIAAGIGGLGSSSQVRVLETIDGGDTWSVRHTSSATGFWGWKLSFPTPEVGYVSGESAGNPSLGLMLKTIDGGQTWSEVGIPNGGSLQGIGFLTPEIGWTSGRGTTSVTTDGGATWEQIALDGSINRFRFLGDSLGFAAGEKIYRLRPLPVAGEGSPISNASGLVSISPNPSSGPVTITYQLGRPDNVRVGIFDLLGRKVDELDEGARSAGRHVAFWRRENHGHRLSPGTYVVRLQTDEGSWAELVAIVGY